MDVPPLFRDTILSPRIVTPPSLTCAFHDVVSSFSKLKGKGVDYTMSGNYCLKAKVADMSSSSSKRKAMDEPIPFPVVVGVVYSKRSKGVSGLTPSFQRRAVDAPGNPIEGIKAFSLRELGRISGAKPPLHANTLARKSQHVFFHCQYHLSTILFFDYVLIIF